MWFEITDKARMVFCMLWFWRSFWHYLDQLAQFHNTNYTCCCHHHNQLQGRTYMACSDSEFNFWNLWLYSGHLVGLLGRGISPTQGLYLHIGQYNTEKRKTHTYMPRAGFEPTIPVFVQSMTVRALDGAASGTGCCYHYTGKFRSPALFATSWNSTFLVTNRTVWKHVTTNISYHYSERQWYFPDLTDFHGRHIDIVDYDWWLSNLDAWC
jgi:hypothetical protein